MRGARRHHIGRRAAACNVVFQRAQPDFQSKSLHETTDIEFDTVAGAVEAFVDAVRATESGDETES